MIESKENDIKTFEENKKLFEEAIALREKIKDEISKKVRNK